MREKMEIVEWRKVRKCPDLPACSNREFIRRDGEARKGVHVNEKALWGACTVVKCTIYFFVYFLKMTIKLFKMGFCQKKISYENDAVVVWFVGCQCHN